MRLLVCVMLVGTVSAYYRYYDERNLVQRHEPNTDDDREILSLELLVRCPVCEHSLSWLANEECPDDKLVISGKTYMKCKWGTYVNKNCGERLDCLRGPNETCTEKREFDDFGKTCMPGYFCNKISGKCEGVTTNVDSALSNLMYLSGSRPAPHRSTFNLNDPIRVRRRA